MTRRGFLARVRLADYGEGVRPHERTQPGPKEDRLRLTRATKHNMSPIFSLHPGDAWQHIAPAIEGEPLGRDHRPRRHHPPRLADRRPRRPRGDRRRAGRRRAADRRRPPPLRDGDDLRARDRRRRAPRLRAHGPRLARGPGPDRVRDAPHAEGPQRHPARGDPRRRDGELRARRRPRGRARPRPRRAARQLRLHGRTPPEALAPAAERERLGQARRDPGRALRRPTAASTPPRSRSSS